MSDDPGGHTIYAESLSHPARTYAAGRRCPSCGAFLRRTNPGPLCDPCGEGPVSRQSSTRGASASGHGSVVATTTQAPRTTDERTQMEGDESHASAEDVLGVMRDGQWHTSTDVGARLGETRQRVQVLIRKLREAGSEFESEPGVGARLVKEAPPASPVEVRHQEPRHFDCDEDVAAAAVAALLSGITPAPDAPDGAAPQSGPDSTRAEQPADDEAAADEPPCPPLRPFAGTVTSSTGSWTFREVAPSHGRELGVLAAIEEMDEASRDRVLFYAFDRWGIK